MWQRWRLQGSKEKSPHFCCKVTHCLRIRSLHAEQKLMSLHSHMRVKVPWPLEQHLCIVRRDIHPLQQPRKEAHMEEGRRGPRFNIISLPKQLPRSTWENSPWKSSVHPVVVHTRGCPLTWVCCVGPPAIRFSRFFLDRCHSPFWLLSWGASHLQIWGTKQMDLKKNLYASFEWHNSRALFHVSSTPLCAQERQLMEHTATRLALLLTFVEGNWVKLRRPLRPMILGWLLWKSGRQTRKSWHWVSHFFLWLQD